MGASIFSLEKSKIDFKEVKTFCDQKISEGLRVEYKEDFPINEKLARTICAFANTAGGIILIGVTADKRNNVPMDIQESILQKDWKKKLVAFVWDIFCRKLCPK